MKATYEELELIISQQRNQLSQLNKQIEQQDKLIKQLLSRISDLENRINKNSKNSSKPPSSDQKPSHKVKKKKENRPYHKGASRKLLPESAVTSRDVRKVERCPKCNAEMQSTGEVQSWQQVELPKIVPLVHQIDLHACQCPNCHKIETPQLKEEEKFLMGPRLEGFINLCLGQFRQGHRSVRELLSLLIPGFNLSQGSVSKVKKRTAYALDGNYQYIRDSILDKSDPIYIDATGWRHKAKNEHAIVMRAGSRIFFSLIPRQNGEAMLKLVNHRKINHLVSDRGLAISKIDARIHQYCLAHLLRNICGFAEHPSTSIAHKENLGFLYDSLQLLFKDKHRLNRNEITLSTWRQYGYSSWKKMKQEVCKILYSNPGKKLERACKRLLKDWKHFIVYLRDKEYPMTNNAAEEALRNLVITRKLCFGSRSEYGRKWRRSMQSCIETLRREGRSIWDFLTDTIKAFRLGNPYPII